MSATKDLTEEKLIELGFVKEVITKEESLEENDQHYFVYELFNGECLMTQTDQEREDEFYYVEFYVMEGAGKFWNYTQVETILRIIKSGENV